MVLGKWAGSPPDASGWSFYSAVLGPQRTRNRGWVAQAVQVVAFSHTVWPFAVLVLDGSLF